MNINSENSKIPIIIDLGSGQIKAGFSGQELPKKIFNSFIGESKYKKIIKSLNKDNTIKKELFIGSECDKNLNILKLRYPINHGVFTNCEDIYPIFNYIFSLLKIPSEEIKYHPILISEPLENRINNRENISKILFEQFSINKLFFASQPVLSLFSTSNTTGVVLESGEGVTQSCAIYEGYSLPNSFQRYDYGGGDVTIYLDELLKKMGYFFETSAEKLLIKEIKEKYCWACPTNISENIKKNSEFEKENHFLPDGNVMKLGVERIYPAEILYSPDIIGLEYPGFHEMILNSINNTDIELRTKLYQNILLGGGNTAINGTANKIYSEIKKAVNQNMKINIHSPKNPHLLCWIGGSVISGMEIFKKMWISKQEWEENGNKILYEKTI